MRRWGDDRPPADRRDRVLREPSADAWRSAAATSGCEPAWSAAAAALAGFTPTPEATPRTKESVT